MRPKFHNAKGALRNPHRAPLAKMKQLQLKQLQTFRRKAKAGKWGEIHADHFDCASQRTL